MQIDAMLASAPSWIVYILMISAAVAFIGRALSEAYPGFARLFGPLGRRWRERGVRRREERFENREVRHADLLDMESQVNHFKRRLDECEQAHIDKDEFFVFDAKQHQEVLMMAAENNCKDVPPLISYLRWRREVKN